MTDHAKPRDRLRPHVRKVSRLGLILRTIDWSDMVYQGVILGLCLLLLLMVLEAIDLRSEIEAMSITPVYVPLRYKWKCKQVDRQPNLQLCDTRHE